MYFYLAQLKLHQTTFHCF